MIKAVILDLDDTLCLTEQACFNMENEVLAQMGRDTMSREIHKSTWGRPLFDAITDRSPGIDVPTFRTFYEPVIKQYTEAGKLDAVSPENIVALNQLAKLGKELVVLTSREHGELAHMLEPAHVLGGAISTFYYRDNMQYHKPDPRAFEHIEREHGWRPDECVYVGDSISDAAAATGAGLHMIISLESKLRREEDFSGYPVDAFIAVFPEIVEAIKMLDQNI